MKLSYNGFRNAMANRVDRMDSQIVKIKSLEEEGRIDETRGNYASNVAMFDFALAEARGLAQLGLTDRTIQAMAEAKRIMDGIALSAIELGSLRPIFSIANKRYNLALQQVESLLTLPSAGGNN